jgi:hypothetical protein
MKRCYFYLGVLAALLPSLARGDFEFTLATCNVLYHKWYVGNAKDPVTKVPHPTMSIEARTAAFQQAFVITEAFVGTDILCFQEWPYQGTGDSGIQAVQFKNSIPATFQGEGTGNPAAYEQEENVRTFFNKNKFDLKQTSFFSFAKNKGILCTILEDKKTHTIVVVFNAHVPWQDMENPDIAKSNPARAKYLQQLDDLETFMDGVLVANKHATWVLCGDFNFDTWNRATMSMNIPKYGAFIERLARNRIILESSAETITAPTAFGGNLTPWLELNDYIFYGGRGDYSVKLSMYPPAEFNGAALIRHHQKPKENGDIFFMNYFSDHAIIRATFTKKDAIADDGGPGPVPPKPVDPVPPVPPKPVDPVPPAPVPPVPPKPRDDTALIQALNTLTNSLVDIARSLE